MPHLSAAGREAQDALLALHRGCWQVLNTQVDKTHKHINTMPNLNAVAAQLTLLQGSCQSANQPWGTWFWLVVAAWACWALAHQQSGTTAWHAC